MNIGIVVLIVLMVPVLTQLLILSYNSKKRHEELLEALKRLEGKL
jgi:hypothetical protein